MVARLFVLALGLLFSLVALAQNDVDSSSEHRFVKAKLETRAKLINSADLIELKAGSLELIENFIDPRELSRTKGKVVNRLDVMDELELRGARLENQPWSDSFWPMSEGILGARYASPAFQRGMRNWRGYSDFVISKGNTLLDIYQRGNPDEIATLSPSEKYDLLIGTLQEHRTTFASGYLTPRMWEETAQHANSQGEIEPWFGICQGWAAASFMVPRPATTLILTAADGKTKIPFFPSDIKGLASFVWAYNNKKLGFIGSRCDTKNVKRDPQTGRVLAQECFDLNPGDFHMAVVNQIGVANRSMVIDVTYDYEVWNQPIFAYQYRLINPQTGRPARSLDDATVSRRQFTSDRYSRFRSPAAASIVGVEMDLTYIVETAASHSEFDSPKDDKLETVTYTYDLELDREGRIIGDEWYQELHPDFLWKPAVDSTADTFGDRHIGNANWNLKQTLPPFWRDIALRNVEKVGMPLNQIVERLVWTSNQGRRRNSLSR